MTVAHVCIVVSLFIPLACSWYAKWSVKGYDGHSPRLFLATLTGRQQRANFAQQNFYETFPAFAVGVLVAHSLHATQGLIDGLAVFWVAVRIAYALVYIADNHPLRSTTWTLSFLTIIALYVIGAF
ncbi:MAG: MAPEG family protein [Candidatus Omnitrophica bacterium]|nr:MAPEG family protein [Candidatus Omnitrophota bacterium]MCB9720125.1 MAPEG family protein [Candidatus Omnitrophota bacterium]